MNKDSILFSITVEEIQDYALEIFSRELTEDDLRDIKDRLYDGIHETIDIVYWTIINDIIKNSHSPDL